ncbi:MAG: FtsQ-type POTRA domain-containing protein [Desulfatibacillaceae bacterium]|nr:FtsQ-type POTRA domain-containing protein [Desulfatibacillaceae bacterium]
MNRSRPLIKKPKKQNRYKQREESERPSWAQRLYGAAVFFGLCVFLCFAALAFIFIHDYFTQSRYFSARHLEVTGNSRLDLDEVYLLAGISPGGNVLSVSPKQMSQRLESHPWVARAVVNRQLPDRIDISIEERRPLAVLDLGERFLMDYNGEIFKRMEESDPKGLPLVVGLSFSDISVLGEAMSPAYKSLVGFLQDGADYRHALPDFSVRAIAVDRDTGITLFAFEPSVAIRLGWGGYTRKIQRLGQVLSTMERGNGMKIDAIDISDSDRVVIKPAGPLPGNKKRVRKEVI